MKQRKTKSTFRNSASGINYQTLEPRQLLASMLYVDFGSVANTLTLNNTDLESLGGPQFAADGHALSSLQTGVAAIEMDLNFDGVFDEVADTDAFVFQVMENLDEIFEVFDVTVVQVNSSNLSEVSARLNSTLTNDAYIYVGGSRPAGFAQYGAAVLNVGNTDDNVGFVFGGDLLNYWMDQELRNQGQEFTGNTQFLNEFDIGPYGSWSVANEVAKQAAISFGLQATEAPSGVVVNWGVFYDVMESRDDQVIPAPPQPRTFSRFDNPIASVSGVSPGQQNSFQLLETNVGLKADAPYYVTMQVNSSFNWDKFEVTIASTANGSLRVTVGDQVFEPTIAEVSNGLIFNGGFTEQNGYFYNSLQGARVIMGQLPGHQIKILNARAIEIDHSLDFGNTGAVFQNIFLASSEVLPVSGLNYFGTVNDNITYEGVYGLEGDDGRDIFRAFERVEHDQIDTTRDKVAASLTSNVFFADKQEYLGHGGNDIFIFDGNPFRFAGGDGDDFIRYHGDRASIGRGGEGYDVVEEAPSRTDVYFGLFVSPDGPTFGSGGIERYDFTSDQPLSYRDTGLRNEVVIHSGDLSRFIDQDDNSYVDIRGGIGSYAARGRASSQAFFVRSTTNDLTIEKSRYVQLSSEFDLTQGNTDDLQHQIILTGTIPDNPGRLVIGAFAGDGVQSLITTRFVTGATPQPIRMTNGYFPHITIHGSNTAPDYIVVAESFRNIELNGNGGNDIFTIGYAYGGEARLNRVRGNLQLDGGAGFSDLVYFQDTEASNIRITNRYVHKLVNPGQSSPTFGLARYDSFETVRAMFSWDSIPTTPSFHATVYGSRSTTYRIDLRPAATSDSAQVPTSELVLIGDDPNILSGRQFFPSSEPSDESVNIRGGYWFIPASQRIFINRINQEWN